jgi:hypothetical protein
MLSQTLIEQARAVDLLALAGYCTSLKRVAATKGGEYAGPCPMCGGRDRFRVQPSCRRWMCRQCSPRWDDAIALEMRLTRSTFPDAVRALIGGRWPVMSIAPPAEEPRAPLSSIWQARARRVAGLAARALWQPQSQHILAWLRARGLTDDTLRHWRIGHIRRVHNEPGHRWDVQVESIYLSAGVLIPGYTADGLTYLKVRRFSSAFKYTCVRGSRPGLYLAETVTDATTVVAVCEGELDALLLWQCLQSQLDLRRIGVVTPGSQAMYPRTEWLALLANRRVLLMFDQDDAGQRGALRWQSQLRDSHIVRWPDAKDLTDYHLRSGSLPNMIRSALSSKELSCSLKTPTPSST